MEGKQNQSQGPQSELVSYDNHELSNWKSCFRKGYLRHVRHWTEESRKWPLIMGICVHSSADVGWRSISEGDDKATAVDRAIAAFHEAWDNEGAPTGYALDELRDEMKFRTPENGERIMIDYIDQRFDWIKRQELIGIEQPFQIVFAGHGGLRVSYNSVIDKTIMEGTIPAGIEHKTTSQYAKNGGFRNEFLNSFFPDSQVEGYIYTLRQVYGRNAMVYIDGILVHKTESAFNLNPQNPDPRTTSVWRDEVRTWILGIEGAKRAYASGLLPMHRAFPRNDANCMTRYGPCEFLDICKYVPEPEALEEPPQGYKEEAWIPMARRVNTGELITINEEDVT